MQLRYYQQEILNKILSSNENDIVQLETGAGKTNIIYEFCKLRSCVVLTHRRELQRQLSSNIIGTSVAMVQSLHRNIDLCGKAQTLIIDEGHHFQKKNIWGKVASNFDRVILFTATPYRLSGDAFGRKSGGIFDKIIQAESLGSLPISELIKKGFLCDFELYRPMKDIRQRGRFEKGKEIAEDPILFCKKHDTGKTVVFCHDICAAEDMKMKFVESGFSAAVVSSRQTDNKNKKIFEDFRNSEFQILLNVNMISEGIDIPDIKTVILLRRTKSLVMYKQWVGRALRMHGSKGNAIIADLAGNSFEHGFPDAAIEWNIDRSPELGGEHGRVRCFSCGNWYHIGETMCPACGDKSIVFSSEMWSIGTVNYINCSNVELARKVFLDNKKKELDNCVDIPEVFTGSTLLDDFLLNIKKKVVHLLGEQDVKNVNKFLRLENDFFFDNFRAVDINNNKKIKKVFRKWLKQ